MPDETKPEKKRRGTKPHGPCGDCVFYHDDETPSEHTTGACHGLPPHRGMGFPIVTAQAGGCSLFQPA